MTKLIRRLSTGRLALASLAACAGLSSVQASATCLMTNLINHTQIVDDWHILFYMNNGEVWQNTLTDRCVGLRQANGFTYSDTTPSYQICDNLVTIRTHDPVNVCLLGAFTKVARKPAP